jgi:adenosine deaminase
MRVYKRLTLRPPNVFGLIALALLFILPASAIAQSIAKSVLTSTSVREQRTARALESARANPLHLRTFLVRMPKGADLHNHLGGAVYAESWIRAGAEDNLCVDLTKLSFVRAETVIQAKPPQIVCGEGRVLASKAYADQHLYDALIDAFSMRSFVPSTGVSGHDHFFGAFSKFSGTAARHGGEWLDEVASRAASQNEQYLELMETPDFSSTALIAKELGWREDLSAFRDELLARGLRDDVDIARAHFDQDEALRREREHCAQPNEASACGVQIRYLYQVLRGFPKEQVFAQALLGFEVASSDPRVVGINFVMAEDGYISMSDYSLHMHMVNFLHALYPKVHISLHAGEIVPGLVTYEGLCCHVLLAIEEAHAERIGHGVDVMYEDRPYALLKEMAEKHVMVEINLTSNDVILGVRGKDHPFPLYREYGVPVALSTDDEGVSRIDLTHEYVRAVETYNLSYLDLKKMVRTGLEHSFLPGASLWREPDVFARTVSDCSRDALGAEKRSAACANFLDSSEKALEQWELEKRFAVFESSF